MIVDIANIALSVLTFIAQVLLIVGAVYFFIIRKKQNDVLRNFLSKRGMLLAFIVALIAMLGSLFYSEIAGFDPCMLCWYQRIFMYSQVFLLGRALIRKEFFIARYSMMLSIVGAVIALYHNYIYYGGTSLFSCDASSVSCLSRYVFEFQYITIPLMALTAFLLISALQYAVISFKKDLQIKS
jgi:disulfide bond formation protein DsbB